MLSSFLRAALAQPSWPAFGPPPPSLTTPSYAARHRVAVAGAGGVNLNERDPSGMTPLMVTRGRPYRDRRDARGGGAIAAAAPTARRR
jgi:hypothetical protein